MPIFHFRDLLSIKALHFLILLIVSLRVLVMIVRLDYFCMCHLVYKLRQFRACKLLIGLQLSLFDQEANWELMQYIQKKDCCGRQFVVGSREDDR